MKVDPENGAIAKELLGVISPQMSQTLQTGLLKAAADAVSLDTTNMTIAAAIDSVL